MSVTEVQELTKKYEKLQHDVNGLRQTAMLNSGDLRDIKNALLGNEEWEQEGLVSQLKNHTQRHVLLEKRVADIEQVKMIEEKLLTYKKGLFGIVFGSVGATIVLFLKSLGVFIMEHFK